MISFKVQKIKQPVLSRAITVFAGILIALFILIALLVKSGLTTSFDKGILLGINSLSSLTSDTIMMFVTHFGDVVVVGLISLILIAYLYMRSRYTAILQVVVALMGGAVVNILLKNVFIRDRPELWQLLVNESTFSFPSGHALLTSMLITTVLLLFCKSKYFAGIVVTGIIYVLVIGISRLYLGVHYPTDILAGWCIGIAWALFVGLLFRNYKLVKTSK